MKITIADVTGRTIRTLTGPANGRDQPRDVEPAAPRAAARAGQGGGGGGGGRGGGGAVEPGTYLVTLTVGGKKLTKPMTVLQDRWLGER